MTINVEDKIAIHELCARVYLSIDGNDAAGFAAGFASDGTFVAPYGNYTDTAAVQEFMEHHIADVQRRRAGRIAGIRPEEG